MSSTNHSRRTVRRGPLGQLNQPYALAAPRYLAAGWSPLPLPAKAKKKPPEGFTGRGNPMATAGDVATWIQEEPTGNIALRLPPGVAGIDVDTYKGAGEKESWLQLLERCGDLPDAPRCTSRNDPDSGIRMFRIPAGVILRDLPAGTNGVKPGEVLQNHHRYAVVWPSIHPDTGRTYLWDDGVVPIISELPWLPDAWIEVLTAPAQHKPAARETGERTYSGDTDWAAIYRYMAKPRLKRKLANWLTELETTGPGDRMPRLFSTAVRLGSVILSGQITDQWAVDRLCEACQVNGFFGKYPYTEFYRCVLNAFRRAGLEAW